MPESAPYETTPMPERLAVVKALRKQFGNDVPADELERVGFVRQEGDEGLISFIAVERLAQLAMVEHEPRAHETLPNTEITLEVPITSKIEAKVGERQLRLKLRTLEAKYFDFSLSYAVDYNFLSAHSSESPLFDAIERHKEIIAKQVDAYPIIQYTTADIRDHTMTTLLGSALPAGMGGTEAMSGFLEIPEDLNRAIDDDSPMLTAWQSEQVIANMQKLRSVMGDISELDKAYEDELSLVYRLETDEWKYPEDTEQGFGLQTSVLSIILAEAGFTEEARKLSATRTLAEARKVVTGALEDNVIKRQFKQREQDWQIRRKLASDPAAIHALSAERAQLKDQLRLSQRPLRGVDMFLNLTKEYSRSSLAAIKEIEDALLVQGKDETVTLRFDTKPDPSVDARAGEISGDCTVGTGLAFNSKTGLRNIKVHLGDKHTGNIYLLQTKLSNSDTPVWHIDAIQIPERSIDWDKFPQLLIDAFVPLAKESGVKAITVNAAQYHVSNYDYVSRGFMKYLGTDQKWVSHNAMAQPEDANKITNDNDRLTTINTERYANNAQGANMIQAASDTQVVLWRDKA